MAIIKAWPPDKSEKKWTSDDPLLALNEQKSSLEKKMAYIWQTRGLKQMILFFKFHFQQFFTWKENEKSGLKL